MKWAEDPPKPLDTLNHILRIAKAPKAEKLEGPQFKSVRELVEKKDDEKTAVKTKPSYPNLTDEYQPTDPNLWKRVLQVAKGDLREFREGDRTIHAPNDGRGYRNMPNNPKGIAWAVKQYKGFGGNWKTAVEDKIPGGLADKGPPKGVDPKQVEKGIKVELEHTDDKDIAREIAYDHLTEDPKYYDKLETIEKHAALRWAEDRPKPMDYQNHKLLFERLAAGGVEVTKGATTEVLRRLEDKDLVRLAGVQGDHHYWDLTEAGRQFVAAQKGCGVSGAPSKNGLKE